MMEIRRVAVPQREQFAIRRKEEQEQKQAKAEEESNDVCSPTWDGRVHMTARPSCDYLEQVLLG